MPGTMPAFATISSSGNLMVMTNPTANLSTWSTLNVTSLTKAPPITGTLAMGFNGTSVFLAALTAAGNVELFTSSFKSASPTKNFAAWSATNVTGAASSAPPLSGSIVVSATSTQLSIAGQAANWGDLFVITIARGSPTWSATDVSVTAGSERTHRRQRRHRRQRSARP